MSRRRSISLNRLRSRSAVSEAKNTTCFRPISVVWPCRDLFYFAKRATPIWPSVAISQHKAPLAATFRRPPRPSRRNLGKVFRVHLPAHARRHDRPRGVVPLVLGDKIILARSACSGAAVSQTCRPAWQGSPRSYTARGAHFRSAPRPASCACSHIYSERQPRCPRVRTLGRLSP